jgi:peptide deformylase
MDIIKAPNPVLSQKAKAVGVVTPAIHELIADMKKTLLAARDPEGVGLAAPQIGKSIQVFIAKPTSKSPTTVYINPQIRIIDEKKSASVSPKKTTARRGKNDTSHLEGCLSLQNIWGTVIRAPKIEITYMDETGAIHTETVTGFLATIMQHEFDHLNGILFPKRVLEQKGTLYKSTKDKDGKDIFTEITL